MRNVFYKLDVLGILTLVNIERLQIYDTHYTVSMGLSNDLSYDCEYRVTWIDLLVCVYGRVLDGALRPEILHSDFGF